MSPDEAAAFICRSAAYDLLLTAGDEARKRKCNVVIFADPAADRRPYLLAVATDKAIHAFRKAGFLMCGIIHPDGEIARVIA
jgi:hypothetical protein